MKHSNFAIYFPYNNKTIGYSGLSNEFIIIEEALFELIKTSKKHNEINELKNIHKDFFEHLKKNRFIIYNKVDELKEVIEFSNSIDYDESKYELQLNPTMNCNFKCWYCYETHISDSKMNPDIVNKVILFVNNLFNENKNIKTLQLNWFGGEPLLQYRRIVLPILKEISKITIENNINFVSVFTSNGILINDNMIDDFKKYNVTSLQITLDGHKKRHNQVRFISKSEGSYDSIVHNIKLLAKKEIMVHVRVNCSKETFPNIEKIAEDFINLPQEIKKNLFFDFRKVWQEKEDIDKKLQSLNDLFIQKGFNIYELQADSYFVSCYANKKNNALINYNGEVFKCTARDFSSENAEGFLTDDGQIHWNSKRDIRLNSRFKNQSCLDCNILPVCRGGCTQISIENEKEYCIYDFDENKKLDVIKRKFESLLLQQKYSD